MARPARRRATIAAALALAGAAVCIGALAIRDLVAIHRVRATFAAVPDGERTRVVRDPSGAAALRDALTDLRDLQAGTPWLHPWARTAGREDVALAAAEAARALEAVERIVAARETNRAWLRRAGDRAAHAATIPELDAIAGEAAAGGPGRDASVEPAALGELLAEIEAARALLEDDDRRNAGAVDDARRALAAAPDDTDALLRVIDRVLPRPDRRPPQRTGALEEVRMAARTRRAALLSTRLGALEHQAADARSARMVDVVRQAIARDPDFRRPEDPSLERAIADAQERLASRSEAIEAWDAGRAAVERALQGGEPAAAAEALARLRPVDARTEDELLALRTGFPARATYALARTVLSRAEAGDWRGARRVAEAITRSPVAWAQLDADGRIVAERTLRELAALEDRMLYEEFRREPHPARAVRYLEGWPARQRRMAPLVQEWLATERRAPHALALESIAWDSTGARAVGSMVTELPDADIEVRVDGTRAIAARAPDLLEGTTTRFSPPPEAEVGFDGEAPLRLSCTARIALLEAGAASPLASGAEDASRADLLAGRGTVLAIADPQWASHPHVVRLRLRVRGLPPLPPWPAAR